MPEIAEVASIVLRLRKHLVGKTISTVEAIEDNLVFKDTTAAAFKASLQGKKVVSAKQWGKYFWLVMDSPPHPLMHFGMTGWVHIKNDPNAHYNPQSSSAPKGGAEWPPKYFKFNLQLKEDPDNEIAFADSRRLARIRLIDHEDGNDLRNVSPLKENGPDPVLGTIEPEWFEEQMKKRKVPIKAWLLDQSAIAGVGNWVGDEILYNARIHPEAYTNALSAAQITTLHRSLLHITKVAVDLEADSSKFPKDWLMLHRWGKGKKKGKDGAKANHLPTGEIIDFVTVGGRTSAFVPSLQKNPGGGGNEKPKRGRNGVKKEEEEEEEATEEKKVVKKTRGRPKKKEVKEEDEDEDELSEAPPEEPKPAPKRRKAKERTTRQGMKANTRSKESEEEEGGNSEDTKPSPKRRKTAKSVPKKEKIEEEKEEKEEGSEGDEGPEEELKYVPKGRKAQQKITGKTVRTRRSVK